MAEKKSYGRSTAGVELTDEVLEQMANEAEDGLDVAKLRRRPGRPSMGSGPAETFPVRLDPELREALGFKLERHGRLLPSFVAFVEDADASFVSSDLALGWARQP